MKLSTVQIGRCGELLVQRQLLLSGIDSAQLTTDSGIDLVAYSNRTRKSLTIQVKSNLEPKPAGGRGQPILDWWVAEDCPAELVALTDLSSDQIWLLTMAELSEVAQQLSAAGHHVCMYVGYVPRDFAKTRPAIEFEKYLLKNRFEEFF